MGVFVSRIAAAVAVFLAAFFFLSAAESPAEPEKTAEVALGGASFRVSVAYTPTLRARGLSGARGLSSDEGMLFVFDSPGRYAFWMKDMLFPIDIVWISEAGEVVGVEKNVRPDSYPRTFSPPADILFALEIPAGAAEENGITPGLRMRFE